MLTLRRLFLSFSSWFFNRIAGDPFGLSEPAPRGEKEEVEMEGEERGESSRGESRGVPSSGRGASREKKVREGKGEEREVERGGNEGVRKLPAGLGRRMRCEGGAFGSMTGGIITSFVDAAFYKGEGKNPRRKERRGRRGGEGGRWREKE